MRKFLFLVCAMGLLSSPCFPAFAQGVSLSGTVKVATDTTALPGATVILQKAAPGTGNPAPDTAFSGTATDHNGVFRFERVTPGEYLLKVNYLGYNPFSRPVRVPAQSLDLGTVLLREAVVALREVQVVEQVPTGEQKGDTAQFNAAAFKTAPDADARGLIGKMPGIALQDGKLQAQGEDVQQVLVDGKPYFGEDVLRALQNLPADVIDKVQVFDRKSDQAEMSGFDDGSRHKTINIVTKPNRRKGVFGKTSAGYGTNKRYLLGASVNLFRDNRRVTVTGFGNNTNASGFGAGNGSQGGGQPPDGTITTGSYGVNYSEKWGKRTEASGNYSFTGRNNRVSRLRRREYALAADSAQVYAEESQSSRTDAAHQFNARLDYKPDKQNRLLLTPYLAVGRDQDKGYFLGRTANAGGPLNQTENQSTATGRHLTFRNQLLYNRALGSRGRGLTFRLHTSLNRTGARRYRLADNFFYRPADTAIALRQHVRGAGSDFAWEGEVSYREPIGERSRLELSYEMGNRQNHSDRQTFDYSEPAGDYSTLNLPLSNTFGSNYLTREWEAGYQYKARKLRVELETQYQRATLQNDQVFPAAFRLGRTFTGLLPSLEIDYKVSPSRGFFFDYRTSTTPPTVQQLQQVIDNANPLQLRTGNPELKQSYHHSLRTRYRMHEAATSQSVFALLEGAFVQQYISSSTLIAAEPVRLNEEMVLQPGSQLTRPVNLNGYHSLRAYVSYGRPIKPIKTNFNVNGSAQYVSRPGRINDDLNRVHTTHCRAGVTLSSNISEKADFTLSTQAGYAIVDNSLRPALNNNFFNQATQLRMDWIAWRGWVWRTELFHQTNAGLAAGYDANYLLWNVSIGKKLLGNQRGEVSLLAFDLLGQNNSIRRNVTELYVEDVRSAVLQRYFMLTFTYNIRHFTGGATLRDFEKGNQNE